jgi:predicted TIM-barrel fold metal-dependent hydrolase
MKIIDMHGHHGRFKGFTFYRSDTDSMIKEMDRNGVETLVLSSHRALFTPDGNLEGTLPALKESKGRFRGYWVIHPHRPEEFKAQIEQFEELREYFIGFKLLSSYHRYPIDGPNYKYMLDYANEHRLPVLMHTWENDRFNGYDNCRNICERYKDFTFLMGHSGFGDYPRFAQLARDYSNAFCELTAVYALDGAIEGMVKIAGSEKVLFGTDLPWFDPAYGIGCILHSCISDKDRENILYNNGAAILGHG